MMVCMVRGSLGEQAKVWVKEVSCFGYVFLLAAHVARSLVVGTDGKLLFQWFSSVLLEAR